jgi:hypothetical protein
MDSDHQRNLRLAADLCRELNRPALAEACSRAGEEIGRLNESLRNLRRIIGILHDAAFPHMASAPPTGAGSSGEQM